MTTLATSPTTEPDLLSLIADEQTPLGKPFADAFRAACWTEAEAHDGWVDPNRVRARLLDHPGYEPRRYSAQWAPACGRVGFLRTHRDVLVPISGEGSRGNGNKSVPMRSWRDLVEGPTTTNSAQLPGQRVSRQSPHDSA